MANEVNQHEHSVGYGGYVLIWLVLLSLTVMTVAVVGFDLGGFTLALALLIAAVKSALVINIFMHIKFDDAIFKVFLALTGAILIVVFVLTAFDVIYR